ncbi:MAG: hypothetical protein QM757_18480 [Paludibaculum sp.]
MRKDAHLDADDGVGAGVEVVAAFEDGDAEVVLFQILAAGGEGLLDDEAEEALEGGGVAEGFLGEDGVEVQPD